MLLYDEFVEECRDRLQDYLNLHGEQAEVIHETVKKINFQKEALIVHCKDDPIAPGIYMGARYEAYLSGWKMEDIVRNIAKDVQEARRHQPDITDLTAEKAKERVYLSVVNAEKNEELLNSVPYRKIEDLACIAKFRLDDESSVVVNETLCRQFRLTAEEVLAIGERNMVKNGYQCESIDLEIERILKQQGASDREIVDIMRGDTSSSLMYIASTRNHMEGAAVIASREAMRDFYAKLGEPFYILPSSRHEVILLPDRCGLEAKELAEMVKDINRQVVDEKDMLSDHVYHFDGRQITRADGIEKLTVFDNKITKSHGKNR